MNIRLLLPVALLFWHPIFVLSFEIAPPFVYFARNASRQPYAIYYKFTINNTTPDSIKWEENIVLQEKAEILMSDGDSATLSTMAISNLYVLLDEDTIYSTILFNPLYRELLFSPIDYNSLGLSYSVPPYSSIDYCFLLCTHQLLSLWQHKYSDLSNEKFLKYVAQNAVVHYTIASKSGDTRPRNHIPRTGKWLYYESPL